MYPSQSALQQQKAFYIQVLNNLQKLSGDSIRPGQEKLWQLIKKLAKPN